MVWIGRYLYRSSSPTLLSWAGKEAGDPPSNSGPFSPASCNLAVHPAEWCSALGLRLLHGMPWGFSMRRGKEIFSDIAWLFMAHLWTVGRQNMPCIFSCARVLLLYNIFRPLKGGSEADVCSFLNQDLCVYFYRSWKLNSNLIQSWSYFQYILEGLQICA